MTTDFTAVPDTVPTGETALGLTAAIFCKRWFALIDTANLNAAYALEYLQNDTGITQAWRDFATRTVEAYDAATRAKEKPSDIYRAMVSDLEDHNLLSPYAIAMFRATGYERDALRALFAVDAFERNLWHQTTPQI